MRHGQYAALLHSWYSIWRWNVTRDVFVNDVWVDIRRSTGECRQPWRLDQLDQVPQLCPLQSQCQFLMHDVSHAVNHSVIINGASKTLSERYSFLFFDQNDVVIIQRQITQKRYKIEL